MDTVLHIISFDVPFPANYGGVIDVYYKLVTLKRLNVKVILHCFSYGRKPSPELERLCERVFYYERKTGLLGNLSLTPYTVRSRQSKELEKNLLKDTHPILFEVLHTGYLLKDPRFLNRKKIYRHSNIEHRYYMELSRSERNLVKKLYLKAEAWKLKRFESILRHADLILAVNQADAEYFRNRYPKADTVYLPSFHSNSDLTIRQGLGTFILFHGNLSVSENYEAAGWLITQVFCKLKFKCIVAGLNPPRFLAELVKRFDNIQLVANPDEEEMAALIADAQVHALYTAQPTGLKLKLLNVLFNGRFLVCNPYMISGTSLQDNKTLKVCSNPQMFINEITRCMTDPFSEVDQQARKKLIVNFDNLANGKKLIGAVFS